MEGPATPTRSETLGRMTQALEAAKRARDRGANVQVARGVLKEARSAFMSGNYVEAMRLADYLVRLFEGGTVPAAPSPTASPSVDPFAAAGRLAQAEEAVRQARARGFNVAAAKAALKEAKRASKARDYAATIAFADQALELCGFSPRANP